jgi:hypothetical protein
MQLRDSFVYNDPLDILRRFVPTPLKAVYRIGSVRVAVQTNDFALLPALTLEAHPDLPGEPLLEWKLIRDHDVHGPLEAPFFLTAESLTLVTMGAPCLLGLDRDRRELLGFIGADVDTRTHQEFLVPFLCRLTMDALSTGLLPCHARLNRDAADD